MCGRFSLSAMPDDIMDLLPEIKLPPELSPRYNIAPSQPVPTVLNNGRNELTHTHWGLIPSWAKDPMIGQKLINARAETVTEKPSFKLSLKRRRCLILASGFYEWQKVPGSTRKRPYHFRLQSGKPFGFAGLWDEWCDIEGGVLTTSTIITTTPNKIVAPIHSRMPVILRADAIDLWLNPDEIRAEEVTPLLRPYPADKMVVVPVSKHVNNIRNDDAECIQPLKILKQDHLFD